MRPVLWASLRRTLQEWFTLIFHGLWFPGNGVAALAGVMVVTLVVAGLSLPKSRKVPKPIAEGDLGDGRIFVIEGVGFGTHPGLLVQLLGK